MTLLELQEVLGERVRIAKSNSAMTAEEQAVENNTSEIIAKLAKQMINNADIVLRRDRAKVEGKLVDCNAIDKVIGDV